MTQAPPERPGRRLRQAALTIFQIGIIVAIWFAAVFLSERWLGGFPPAIAGLGIALLLLALGLLRREWLVDGASWLLREMLLFFIPVVIAIINYAELIRAQGIAILLVVLGSTTCVMVATAFAVDLAWRLERRWRARKGEQA